MRRILVSLVVVVVAAGLAVGIGCSSSSNGNGAADAGGDGGSCDKIDSACGQPCDPGNSLGIGKFCRGIVDCQGTAVPTLCATLGNSAEHFCTAMCNPPDAGGDGGPFLASCGENATCQCQGGQCGCYPSTCP
jgi:hypothetical protein